MYVRTCMYVCIYVCMYVCMCVCMYAASGIGSMQSLYVVLHILLKCIVELCHVMSSPLRVWKKSRKPLPCWCTKKRSSFYGNLGKWRNVLKMLLVCVEWDKQHCYVSCINAYPWGFQLILNVLPTTCHTHGMKRHYTGHKFCQWVMPWLYPSKFLLRGGRIQLMEATCSKWPSYGAGIINTSYNQCIKSRWAHRVLTKLKPSGWSKLPHVTHQALNWLLTPQIQMYKFQRWGLKSNFD